MDFAKLKERLRIIPPPELLKKIKDVLLSFWSKMFSLPKGMDGLFSGHSNDDWQDEASPFAEKKRLILFGLGGAAILIFGLVIIFIIRNVVKPDRTEVSNITSGSSIPVEEFFSPSEPDFVPGFLPERESRRFWSLDDIRQYWKTPGNSDWWREEIKSTVDSLLQGIP